LALRIRLLLGTFPALELLHLALQLFRFAPEHLLLPALPECLLLPLLLLGQFLLAPSEIL